MASVWRKHFRTKTPKYSRIQTDQEREIHNNSGSSFRDPDRKAAHIPSPAFILRSCQRFSCFQEFPVRLGDRIQAVAKKVVVIGRQGWNMTLVFFGGCNNFNFKKCLYCIIKINNTIKVYGKNINQTNRDQRRAVWINFRHLSRSKNRVLYALSLSNWLLFWS